MRARARKGSAASLGCKAGLPFVPYEPVDPKVLEVSRANGVAKSQPKLLEFLRKSILSFCRQLVTFSEMASSFLLGVGTEYMPKHGHVTK